MWWSWCNVPLSLQPCPLQKKKRKFSHGLVLWAMNSSPTSEEQVLLSHGFTGECADTEHSRSFQSTKLELLWKAFIYVCQSMKYLLWERVDLGSWFCENEFYMKWWEFIFLTVNICCMESYLLSWLLHINWCQIEIFQATLNVSHDSLIFLIKPSWITTSRACVLFSTTLIDTIWYFYLWVISREIQPPLSFSKNLLPSLLYRCLHLALGR